MDKKINKKKIAIGVVLAAVVLAVIGVLAFTSGHNDEWSMEDRAGVTEEQGQTADGRDQAVPDDSIYQVEPDTDPAQPEQAESTLPAPPSADRTPEQQAALRENCIIEYYGEVQDDTTGNWRYAIYSSRDAQEDIALDYYRTFFNSDQEVHALINLAAGNTARITPLDNNTLDVTILEHVDGEEQNAATLFSGRILKKYWVYMDSGEHVEVAPD